MHLFLDEGQLGCSHLLGIENNAGVLGMDLLEYLFPNFGNSTFYMFPSYYFFFLLFFECPSWYLVVLICIFLMINNVELFGHLYIFGEMSI
jgi:hypothetical protein